MLNFIFPFLLCVSFLTGAAQTDNMKTVTKNGMSVSWRLSGDKLIVRMSAPTAGWVAVGLNTTAGLSATNLIMGSVADGAPSLSDRYIVKPGEHRGMAALGGRPAALLIAAAEDASGTVIEFSLPVHPQDAFHHRLLAGEPYHLLLAYSRDDDFAHHSMMRTSVTISL